MSRQSSSFLEQKRWAANRIAPRIDGPCVPCPACADDPTRQCMSCYNTRAVAADRVCAVCGSFTSYCTCRPRNERVAEPKRPYKGRRG